MLNSILLRTSTDFPNRIVSSYSLRSVNLIAGVLGRAGESGQEKRLEAAKTGQVTWETDKILKQWAKTDEKWMRKYKAEQKEKALKEEELSAAKVLRRNSYQEPDKNPFS